MLRSAFFVFFLLWRQDSVWSVRLIEHRVPAYEREGGRTLLGCLYDMEGEALYSVKWYKDGREFFRFVPKENPQLSFFSGRPGLHVDMARSSNSEVALVNLTHESEGQYSCEVSGESPKFNTAKSHKIMTIHLLPESGPYMTGIKESYFFDETVAVNCSSSGSRPMTHMKWLLNGQPVPASYLRGPWYRVSAERPDATETILQLNFIVAPQHFDIDGAMELKCQATIAPLYQREIVSTRHIHGLLMGEPFNHASDTSKHSTVTTFLWFAFILIL